MPRKLLRDSTLFGFFDHGFGADYYDYAVFGDGIARAVGFRVVADYGAFGQAYVAVNDGAADAATAADVHVIEDDALIQFAVAIDAHVEAENGFGDASAGNDGAGADDGIERDAHARWDRRKRIWRADTAAARCAAASFCRRG